MPSRPAIGKMGWHRPLRVMPCARPGHPQTLATAPPACDWVLPASVSLAPASRPLELAYPHRQARRSPAEHSAQHHVRSESGRDLPAGYVPAPRQILVAIAQLSADTYPASVNAIAQYVLWP